MKEMLPSMQKESTDSLCKKRQTDPSLRTEPSLTRAVGRSGPLCGQPAPERPADLARSQSPSGSAASAIAWGSSDQLIQADLASYPPASWPASSELARELAASYVGSWAPSWPASAYLERSRTLKKQCLPKMEVMCRYLVLIFVPDYSEIAPDTR